MTFESSTPAVYVRKRVETRLVDVNVFGKANELIVRKGGLKWVVLLFLALVQPGARADESTSKLIVAPSSSKLAGGTANLVVGVLSRADSAYTGEYRIKVFPYFFKSESGKLLIKVSETSLRRMVEGDPTSFAGRAITDGTGETRKITAKVRPTANDHGALTFTVATENGPLVFNTSYRISPQ
ncbi:MAG: hypothetical protein M3Q86_12645 [Verrucomicrobiota bacterium]|nr:hypothetical protein [Verrucomicrobiota bacterium]